VTEKLKFEKQAKCTHLMFTGYRNRTEMGWESTRECLF